MDKLFGYTAEQWMRAVLDMLNDSSYWQDIQYKTGLSDKRCKEIEKMFHAATKEGWPKKAGPQK